MGMFSLARDVQHSNAMSEKRAKSVRIPQGCSRWTALTAAILIVGVCSCRAAGAGSKGTAVTKPAATGKISTTVSSGAGADRSELKDLLDGEPKGLVLQMLAYVLVILVVGGIAIIVVKKWAPKLHAGKGRNISMIETLYLGPRKTVHLIEASGRRFLIGAGNDNISMLTELTGGFPEVLESQSAGAGAESLEGETGAERK